MENEPIINFLTMMKNEIINMLTLTRNDKQVIVISAMILCAMCIVLLSSFLVSGILVFFISLCYILFKTSRKGDNQ